MRERGFEMADPSLGHVDKLRAVTRTEFDYQTALARLDEKKKSRAYQTSFSMEEEGELDDSGSEGEARPKQKEERKQENDNILKESMKDLVLRRDDLQNFLYKPKFQSIVVGLFVRLSTSTENNYILGEIEGVEDGKRLYELGRTTTLVQLRVKEGARTKLWEMRFVSNNKSWSQEQWTQWELVNRDYGIPSPEELKRRKDRLKAVVDHCMNPHEIDRMIERNLDKVLSNQEHKPEEIKGLLSFLENQRHTIIRKHFDQGDMEDLPYSPQEQDELTAIQQKVERLKSLLDKSAVKAPALKEAQRVRPEPVKEAAKGRPQKKERQQAKLYMRKTEDARLLATKTGSYRCYKRLLQFHSQQLPI